MNLMSLSVGRKGVLVRNKLNQKNVIVFVINFTYVKIIIKAWYY